MKCKVRGSLPDGAHHNLEGEVQSEGSFTAGAHLDLDGEVQGEGVNAKRCTS